LLTVLFETVIVAGQDKCYPVEDGSIRALPLCTSTWIYLVPKLHRMAACKLLVMSWNEILGLMRAGTPVNSMSASRHHCLVVNVGETPVLVGHLPLDQANPCSVPGLVGLAITTLKSSHDALNRPRPSCRQALMDARHRHRAFLSSLCASEPQVSSAPTRLHQLPSWVVNPA
jgi:hypothetical protein